MLLKLQSALCASFLTPSVDVTFLVNFFLCLACVQLTCLSCHTYLKTFMSAH